jgi:hypothetical protein
MAKRMGVQCIVAIGNGSVIDSGKLIRHVLEWEISDTDRLEDSFFPNMAKVYTSSSSDTSGRSGTARVSLLAIPTSVSGTSLLSSVAALHPSEDLILTWPCRPPDVVALDGALLGSLLKEDCDLSLAWAYHMSNVFDTAYSCSLLALATPSSNEGTDLDRSLQSLRDTAARVAVEAAVPPPTHSPLSRDAYVDQLLGAVAALAPHRETSSATAGGHGQPPAPMVSQATLVAAALPGRLNSMPFAHASALAFHCLLHDLDQKDSQGSEDSNSVERLLAAARALAAPPHALVRCALALAREALFHAPGAMVPQQQLPPGVLDLELEIECAARRALQPAVVRRYRRVGAPAATPVSDREALQNTAEEAMDALELLGDEGRGANVLTGLGSLCRSPPFKTLLDRLVTASMVTKHCSQCQQSFDCGSALETCWCMDTQSPGCAPMPGCDCLCEICLANL